MMLPPPTFRSNATAVAHPLMYTTRLSAAKEALSLNATKKYVKKSYTLLDKTLPQNLDVKNNSSIRTAAYQRGIYVRGVIDWIHGAT